MAPGIGGASMANRTGANLIKLLMELQASRNIYFYEILPRRPQQLDQPMRLPIRFVEEHINKFDRWVILRTLSSAKPWTVNLGICKTEDGNSQVLFVGGWEEFVADNRLQGGDFLVFVLNPDARSEFWVYVFRGVDGVQDIGGFTASEEAAPTSSESNSGGEVPPQHRTNCEYPSFCRRLTANHRKSGSMELPGRFVRAHRMLLQGKFVKVQGVHEESHVQVVRLYRSQSRPTDLERLYFVRDGWREFVRANDLQEGQELQFTLIADSTFIVREVFTTD